MKKNTNSKISNDIDELILSYYNCKDDSKRRAIHINIVEKGMILVKKIASSLSRQSGVSFEDLVQVGALGLIKAIETFSPDKNAKFTTYASYHIKGELSHYMRDKAALIKTPRKIQELIVKIYTAAKKLSVMNNNEPTVREIAEYINVPPEKVEEVMNIDKYKYMISLDQAISSDDDDSTLLEKIPATDYQETQNQYETKLVVENAINKLKPDLKKILELNFFEELNQREIAEKLGISQMQVSRKLRKALNEMYEIIRRNPNDSF